MNFIKWLLVIVATLLLVLGAFLYSMRFSDGPVEIFSGGPFTSGEVYRGPEPDWSQFTDRATLQLQSIEPPRSRTLWLVVVDGRLFVPSAYMNTKFGKIWKKWPIHAEKNGEAFLRLDNTIYPRQMVRLNPDHKLVPEIIAAMTAKYPGEITIEQIRANDTWLFELAPR